MNVIDDALDALTAALAAVLPGRTSAEPRTFEVGESISVDVPTITVDNITRPRYQFCDFPITITADGVDRAQVAFLNDAVAKVWDACTRLERCYPAGSRPVATRPGENRAVVVTARMLLTGTTFCLPDQPTAAAIPPEPIDQPPSEED